MPNALASETSPYLLQHKDNPVAWRPWGADAFAAARAENKPVLLSVGYAACHWCHVMAHESFEDSQTAALMNDGFVNIKVDREERPDVDTIYQSALAMMGEHGGWPLTMFLTPGGEPFWGGTYFPPEPRYGRPAFRQVLQGVGAAWRDQQDQINHNVAALKDALRRQAEAPDPEGLDPDLLDAAANQLLTFLDPTWGGLQGAPKFPQPSIFRFLWHAYRRTGDEAMGQAVTLLLDRMCQGGIYDHLGGGFARYATDAQWLVPHFEKMLYDNAQLLELLTAAWRHTRSPLYAERISETIGWLMREMTAEHGTFAASLDADSEGEEGKFYVWGAAEIDVLLTSEQAQAVKRLYGVSAAGNWEGRNILHRNHQGGTEDSGIAAANQVLWQARERRVRPGRDDKVLADWNGLTIAALAEAGFAFDRSDWLAAARSAFDGIRTLLGAPDGRLGHAYCRGRRLDAAMLDDYAAMARAAISLYEITADAAYLAQAQAWVRTADEHYWDKAGGGYFFTSDDASDLIVRTKAAHDTAVPSGNGLMAEALAKLFYLTSEDRYRQRAETTIGTFSGLVRRQFANMGTLLDAYEFLSAPTQVVVVGDAPDLLRCLAETDVPRRLLQQVSADAALPPGHPASGKGLVDGKPAGYVCRGPTCSMPATTPDELRTRLTAR